MGSLPIIHDGLVHDVTLGIHPLLRACAGLSIFGHNAHHGFPVFLAGCLYGVVADVLQADASNTRLSSMMNLRTGIVSGTKDNSR